MAEYKCVDYRMPRIEGEEDRGDLDGFQMELNEDAEGWRIAHILGGPSDERILVFFERS